MANILLGTLRDYWKGVYDAIATGGSAKKATGLQVAGSDGTNAQIIKTNADGEVLTQLSGRIVEYAWFSDDITKPTPTEGFAWGNEFNKTTGELIVYGWTGAAWVEVV